MSSMRQLLSAFLSFHICMLPDPPEGKRTRTFFQVQAEHLFINDENQTTLIRKQQQDVGTLHLFHGLHPSQIQI